MEAESEDGYDLVSEGQRVGSDFARVEQAWLADLLWSVNSRQCSRNVTVNAPHQRGNIGTLLAQHTMTDWRAYTLLGQAIKIRLGRLLWRSSDKVMIHEFALKRSSPSPPYLDTWLFEIRGSGRLPFVS